jgi:hypothetical protein
MQFVLCGLAGAILNESFLNWFSKGELYLSLLLKNDSFLFPVELVLAKELIECAEFSDELAI